MAEDLEMLGYHIEALNRLKEVKNDKKANETALFELNKELLERKERNENVDSWIDCWNRRNALNDDLEKEISAMEKLIVYIENLF
jgi:tRNA G18 (ribose-2'-O)-methylase SpoU